MSFKTGTQIVDDYSLAVAVGAVGGVSTIRKFGRNIDIDTGATEHIWSAGGILSWLTSASAMEALSSDANDTSAGSGAQQIFVQGLDGSFNEISETVIMNGITAVALANTYTRIQRAFVSRIGTYSTGNAGDITIRVASGGSTQASIMTGIGQTQKSQFTIPNGKSGYLSRFSASVASTKSADVFMCRRDRADVTSSDMGGDRLIVERTGISGGFELTFNSYDKFEEKTDIWAQADVSANNTEVECAYDLFLVDS